LLAAGLLVPAARGAPIIEEKFELLQIKADVYQNVTVTTVKKEFICFTHSRGMGSAKVVDLPDDAKLRLGFKVASKGGGIGIDPSAEVKKLLARVDLTPVEPLRKAWIEAYMKGFDVSGSSRNIILASVAVLLLLYLLFCYCAKLICLKTGNKPGPLIWLPVLQWLPLVKSASMQPIWVLLLHLPLFNIVGYITWAIKITRARAKPGAVALMFMLPGLNVLAFL